MKFYPSTDPKSPYYDSKLKAFNEEESRRRKILRIREDANRAMNPEEARRLNGYADQLAQREMPLPRPAKKRRQRNLFDPERLD